MPFVLRLQGKTIAEFDSAEAALAEARGLLQRDANQQPEVVDTTTGRPVAPGATAEEREALARKVGF